MEFFILLLIITILVVCRVLRSPGYKGKVGEEKVAIKLGKLIDKLDVYTAFHDVTLRTPDGTTQIDHILLSPFGIFVIETKNMKGWIFGGEWQKRWTQVIYKKKTSFQNPIRQNYKHVKAIQQLLSVNQKLIFNVVVFLGDAEFKTNMPENVINIRSLMPYIRKHAQPLIDQHDLEKYNSLIIKAVSGELISGKEHQKNVKERRKNPLCPRCGSPMILRVARKGGNKGKKFWGCPNFPTCRGIKNVG